MLFDGELQVGFFSGGCVEADVAAHAAQVLAEGAPRRLAYGAGSPFADIRLVCGGRLELLVERVAPDDPALTALLSAELERRPVLWRSDGRARACTPVPAGAPRLAREAAAGAIARRHDPPWRLLVVGHDPTALAIAELASRSGVETTICRPAGPEDGPPLPGVGYSREPPAVVLGAWRPDAWTGVAVATHALEEDDAALAAALTSGAGYVGALGSARRLPARLARLRRAGVPDAALARLRAPIGLPGVGKAPWAVAVSVMAELFQTLGSDVREGEGTSELDAGSRDAA
jgi:xanthine dehydrogenase accessory factor